MVQNCHFLYRFIVLWQYMSLNCSNLLPEDGTVSAETCRKHLINNINIQLNIAFSLKIKATVATGINYFLHWCNQDHTTSPTYYSKYHYQSGKKICKILS